MNSFINRLVNGGKVSKRGVTVAPVSSLGAAINTAYGVNVNNDSAMKLTAFMAGVRYFADNIGSLPKVVTRNCNAGKEELGNDHYLVRLLNRPNSYTNKFVFWSTLTTWLKGWGNAYAIIKRNAAGTPVSLHQVHPSYVTVALIDGRKWYKVKAYDKSYSFLDGVYPSEDMIHVMELSLDGINGIDVVRYNAMSLGKSLAQESFAEDYYRKKGHIKAVMETDSSLGDEQYEKFMHHFADASGNFETPLLEYGIKYKPLSINPVSASLIQSETMSIQDIARMLNIPPHMLAELSHATFSNIEHQTIQFVQYSLRPVAKKLEVECEEKLVFDNDRDSINVKVALDGLLRGDTAARSQYYHTAILDGYMSRNEVRSKEGLPAAEGLDEFLVPLNEGVVGGDNE